MRLISLTLKVACEDKAQAQPELSADELLSALADVTNARYCLRPVLHVMDVEVADPAETVNDIKAWEQTANERLTAL